MDMFVQSPETLQYPYYTVYGLQVRDRISWNVDVQPVRKPGVSMSCIELHCLQDIVQRCYEQFHLLKHNACVVRRKSTDVLEEHDRLHLQGEISWARHQHESKWRHYNHIVTTPAFLYYGSKDLYKSVRSWLVLIFSWPVTDPYSFLRTFLSHVFNHPLRSWPMFHPILQNWISLTFVLHNNFTFTCEWAVPLHSQAVSVCKICM